jgi:hypothetical protein
VSFQHGRGTVLKLDLADGSGPSDLTTASGSLTAIAGFEGTSDRPETQTFGNNAKRYQVLGLRDGGTISLSGLLQQVAGTRIHGRQTRVIADQFPLTSYFKSGSVSRQVELPETQTFGNNWKRRQLVGLKSGSMSLSGLYDSQAGGSDAALRQYLAAAGGTPAVVSFAPSGFTIGNIVDMLQGYCTKYGIDSNEGSEVGVSGDFVSDDVIDIGVSLHDLIAETTGGATVNYASVDETAVSTVGGWVAHLHCSAYSGFTSVTVKIQDSADNAIWADLASATFTALTAVGSQRIDGGLTATVRRYVRAVATTVGAGSATFAVTFGRRGSTYGAAGTYRHFCELYGLATTSTYQYGPEGSATGKRRYTGEARLSKFDISYDEGNTTGISVDLMCDDAVTEDTWP